MPPTYDPPADCQPPARVYVDGNRIPLINDGVKLEFRKQGPLDFQSTADIYFPQIGPDGQDWFNYLNNTLYRVCDVEIRHHDEGNYYQLFHGLVQGIGAGTETANEMRIRAADPSFMLGEIPANFRWNGANLPEAMGDISDTISEYILGFDVVSVVGADLEKYERQPSDGNGATLGDNIYTYTERGAIVDINETFSPNKHTLEDVFTLLIEQSDFFFSFDFRGEFGKPTTRLIVTEDPTSSVYESKQLGGEVVFTENNMLAEINPINAVELRGKLQTPSPGGGAGGLQRHGPQEETEAKKFPIATAVHEPTRELAGRRMTFKPRRDEKKTSDLQKLKNRAKRLLKKKLDSAGFGNATVLLNPKLRPFTIIESPPYCDDDAPILDYEVENVTHHAGAHGVPKTEFQASFATRKEDIIVEGEMRTFSESDE